MGRLMRCIALSLLLASTAMPGFAQDEAAPEQRLDIEELRKTRGRIEADTTLGEDLQKRILEHYDNAISSGSAAKASVTQAKSFDRERAGIGRMIDALKAELNRPEPEPRISLDDDTTQLAAESELARERARLKGARSALRGLEQLAEERTTRRSEISRRLGGLDQEIETINDELRTAAEREAHPEYKTAFRASLLARKEAARREIELLRSELALLQEKSGLLPWRIDQAQRRVAHGEAVVDLLEKETRQLRRRDAQTSLNRVHELSVAASERSPALSELAAETQELAELLWGPEGVIVRTERANFTLGKLRKSLSDLDRVTQLTRRKFDAFGHRGSIQRWWPEVPDDFPEAGEVRTALRALELEIPEVQHQLIRFEQQRSATRDVVVQTTEALEADLPEGESIDPEIFAVARDLLDTRRELLDQLIQDFGRLSNQLVALQTDGRRFADQEEAVIDFLYERLLWVRSVPRPIIPRPGDLGAAVVWVFSPDNWKDAIDQAFEKAKRHPGLSIIAVVGFVLLLWLRPRIRRRLETLTESVTDPAKRSFAATLEAGLYTALLAAPMPFALYVGHRALLDAEGSDFVLATATALFYVAWIAALLEITRQMFVPDGLAESHFGWPSVVTRRIHRGLRWREVVFLPLIFIAIQLGEAGIRLHSPTELQVYNNALGRSVFVIALSVLGISLLNSFRPRIRTIAGTQRPTVVWQHRIYMWAYPIVVLATLLPATLAVVGYYITGYLLAFQMLRTTWIVMLVMIAHGFLLRWRRVIPASTDESAEVAKKAESQVDKLSRFAVIVVAAIALWGIWSDAVPGLEIMKRVQVWPRVAMIEEDAGGSPITTAPETAAATTEKTSEGESAKAPTIPGMPKPASGADSATAPPTAPMTLWNVLEAVLALIITVVLVANIPGLTQMVLSRRTRLDTGARIAIGTLVRYTIIIVGVSASFGLLGVSWGKIQWLAAALTFGLGFGLQEIVANFVSGLILLIERPVRVGDAVTVGTLQGRVSRIQIRATTITLWDRSEMIVPNKEFITTKLVNWTLSDSERRLSIPLRVAYGSDLQQVRDTLLEVARGNPNVLDEPAPHVLLLDFGDDALKFELRVFVDFGAGLETQDALRMEIDRVFRERGIKLALPQLDVHVPGGGAGPPGQPKGS